MARAIHKLTDVQIRQTKPDPSGKALVLSDGGNLRLLIEGNGSKTWQFRKTVDKKETTYNLGAYPQMTLAEARERAADYRKKAKDGVDLGLERRLRKLQQQDESANTFQNVADELLALKRRNGISASYHKKIEGALRANLFPSLGPIPIGQITPALLKGELKRIEARGSLNMLGFVLQVVGEIFDLAKSDNRFVGDNPATTLRRNVFAKHRGESMMALAWEEMPGFLHRLDGFYGEFATACCIRLLIWTACRPGEVRQAKWSEFNLDTAMWTIPAERMKLRQEHKVPLPKQAVRMLKELKLVTGHKDYLFPSQRGSKKEVVSDMAILQAIRRTVCHNEVTAHGFRAVFRTHAGESLLWPEAVLEAALAHGKKNAVVGAYDRTTYLPERTKLMQWYADELDRIKKGVANLTISEAA